jgi:hypothetical protein
MEYINWWQSAIDVLFVIIIVVVVGNDIIDAESKTRARSSSWLTHAMPWKRAF